MSFSRRRKSIKGKIFRGSSNNFKRLTYSRNKRVRRLRRISNKRFR